MIYLSRIGDINFQDIKTPYHKGGE